MNTLTHQKDITDISSMLLPLEGVSLLLPGVAVAEIINFIPPEPLAESSHGEALPLWSLGNISWRDQKLLLVSYEALTDKPAPIIREHCRIAIINNTGLNDQLEFFAILLQGTPRLLRLAAEDITANNEKTVELGEKLHVQVSDEAAVMPDIAFIEKSIIDYLELT